MEKPPVPINQMRLDQQSIEVLLSVIDSVFPEEYPDIKGQLCHLLDDTGWALLWLLTRDYIYRKETARTIEDVFEFGYIPVPTTIHSGIKKIQVMDPDSEFKGDYMFLFDHGILARKLESGYAMYILNGSAKEQVVHPYTENPLHVMLPSGPTKNMW